MNLRIIILFICSLVTTDIVHAEKNVLTPKIIPKVIRSKKIEPSKTDVAKQSNLIAPIHTKQTASIHNVPFVPELQTAKIASSIIQGWRSLYQAFEDAQNNQSIITTPQLTELFSTNFYSMIAMTTDPQKFPQFNNDPQGTLHFNYVTKHLHDTAKRMGSIVHTTDTTVVSSATCRDLGVIVNWYNNTDAQFSINQTDGKTSTQIGVLEPGMNGLNLHLAALQTPASLSQASKSTTSSTAQYFSLTEQNASNPTQIMIKIMTGAELIAFLRTLYRDPKAVKDDTFEMNGLPTSPEYITTLTDDYLVLIQNPTPVTASQRDPNQRIQAIDITKFTQPYLLTMQINAEKIDPNELKNHQEQQSSSSNDNDKILIYQPSITIAQLMMNATIKPINFPIMILPDFADKNPELHALWMLATTTTLAAHTNFKLFGKDSFANAFEYFNNLSCFNNQNRYTFCIDLYNTLEIGTSPHDTPWLLGACIFETYLFSDCSQIHTSQNSYNNIICNGKDCFYLNFQLIASHEQKNNTPIVHFTKQGFNIAYSHFLNTTPSIDTIPISYAKENVFVDITKINNTKYIVTYSSKDNVLLSTKIICVNTPISNVEFQFLRQSSNWMGSKIIKLQNIPLNEFKITYEAINSENLYKLAATKSSCIDKKNIIHTIYLNNNQINNMHLKLYKYFKNANFTYCSVIDSNNIAPFLLNLTSDDWHNGIYCIFDVHNAHFLSSKNPGKLITTFYKKDHSFIGRIITQGLYQHNINKPGIQSPVIYYDLYCNAFNPLYNIYLSTGMLLKRKNS